MKVMFLNKQLHGVYLIKDFSYETSPRPPNKFHLKKRNISNRRPTVIIILKLVKIRKMTTAGHHHL